MDQLPVGYTVGGCLSVEAACGGYVRLHGNIAWGKIAPLSVSQGSNSGQVGLSAGNPGSKLGRASGPARLFYRGLLSLVSHRALPKALRPHTRMATNFCSSKFCLRRSEEHTSELQSLMRISYAVFCLKKKQNQIPI